MFVAHPHQVARLLRWQTWRGERHDFSDLFWPFPNRNPPNREARQIVLTDGFYGRRPEVEIGATLHDAKERLLARTLMGFDASVQPTDGALVSITQPVMVLEAPMAVGGHAFAEAHNIFGITGRRAIVKRHDDVRANIVLDFHRSLGAEINPRTIDDGSKTHTILTKSIDVRHRIGLVPPRVRQDGTGPTHELMTAPSPRDRRIAGAKHQVIRIVQNDLRSRLGNLVRPQAFHT